MRIAIISNAHRVLPILQDASALKALAEKYDLNCDVFIEEPKNLLQRMAELMAKTYQAFLVVGGDGTVRTVAGYVMATNLPLIICPAGTFNYFAKELAFPPDLEKIFAIIKNNKQKRVDIAEVNNEIFINHCSLGFYSHVLKLKQRHKKWLGTSRVLKVLFTAFNLLRVIPVYHFEMEIDKQSIKNQTCFLFVGNNYHYTNIMDFGTRQTLTSGLLALYIFNCTTRFEIIKCMLSILFNTFNKEKYLTEYQTNNLVIHSQAKTLNVVVDGELLRLDAPLTFKSNQKQLTVFVA